MGIRNILSQKVSFFPRLTKIITVLKFMAIAFPAFSTPKTLILGGEKGWNEIAGMNGVTVSKRTGQFGYDAVELSTQTLSVSSDTDMLLTFDDEKNFYDAAGNYSVLKNNLVYSTNSAKGNGAALSKGEKKGLSLSGKNSALFGKTGFAGSFTIEFWLCPSLAENGEMVLSWRSSLNNDINSEYQMISASFFNNHLEWAFNNIFNGYREKEVHISGYSTIVPDKWTRHTISFNEESGLLEYLVDGRTESLKFITLSGHENGTVCYPVIGVKAAVELCPDYVGKIDSFKISRLPASNSRNDILSTGNEKFSVEGGKFVTKPLLVSHSATIEQIDALMNVPAETDIRFYVRSGDNCYGWNENYPAWKEIVPGEKISDISGLYFQLSAEFLPDGNGNKTPRLTEISIKYDEQNEPLPPFAINAKPGDSCVTLNWSFSVDENAGGYYVYYGNRPGEYLGRVALEGSSPVNVGNTTSVTLTGLENGRIYYFAVSAYSKIDGRINGTLSKEVFARPSARLSLK
ncbi:fibronectin type III domain-containing protein [Treponema sp.]|uniref:fibronectin type III domain-containing protein n=1 Tax=Treponema sp. TaxID=166 RepID=UPI00388F7095